MKYIKTLILAVGLAAGSIQTGPPIFSQKNSCCWIASWVQLINNMPEIGERIATLGTDQITDYNAFAASDMGKKLAKETRWDIKFTSEVEIPALDYYKEHHFSQKNIENNRSYLTILKTIATDPTDQLKLDGELEKLQKNLAGTNFGKFYSSQLLETGNGFIEHPVFEDLIAHYPITGTSWKKTAQQGLEDYIEFMSTYWKLNTIPPLLLLEIATPSADINLRDSFTLDLTKLIPEDKHPLYELIGIGVAIPGSHWWAFIRDQYDPETPWWRCDTLTGNKRVSQEEIITESSQHPPTYLLYRKIKPDIIPEKTSGVQEHELMKLTEALWKLS